MMRVRGCRVKLLVREAVVQEVLTRLMCRRTRLTRLISLLVERSNRTWECDDAQEHRDYDVWSRLDRRSIGMGSIDVEARNLLVHGGEA